MDKVSEKLACPLCGGNNVCMNIIDPSNSKACWCMDKSIRFTEELLQQVPIEARGEACICKTCAMAYQDNKGVKTYQP